MASSGSSPRLRAVLFDRDDTIAYTDPAVYREAAAWAAGRFGLDAQVVSEALAAQWKARALSWRDLRTHEDEADFWMTYGLKLTGRLGLPESLAAEWMEAYPYERYMKPVPGAREVLGELCSRGLKIGVLSNTLPSIHRTLQALELHDLVDVAVATCVIGTHKPGAGAYAHALEALGVPPHEVLFVDDKVENVAAARELGMQATLIDLQGENPQAIHDLRAVLELVG
ncbi:putative (S)-2-haloacid dehalogenase [Deinococcus deserti VCD115]|uniref:Putative (S)-2-haloacid dehalogenase n=2 Tax=Deinococcus TaxID=1298 RepID=C1CV42_DEIDV|nr:HAD-IA family hydrolase [Deinococcus deserti]ACO46059.2 putative (S)-2-haloacid dehalogenase [Deinococcus deserti VCD115]